MKLFVDFHSFRHYLSPRFNRKNSVFGNYGMWYVCELCMDIDLHETITNNRLSDDDSDVVDNEINKTDKTRAKERDLSHRIWKRARIVLVRIFTIAASNTKICEFFFLKKRTYFKKGL